MSIPPHEMTYIVAITAFTNSETVDDCAKAGIRRVLNKPITFPILNEVMWKYFFFKA
jgi:response regulator of citrate/malate metabolism